MLKGPQRCYICFEAALTKKQLAWASALQRACAVAGWDSALLSRCVNYLVPD